jgi:hypothetical protein
MSDLYTKAAKAKTSTKLWVIAIVLLITVSFPYDDNHYQPNQVTTTTSRPPAVVLPTSPADVVAPKLASHKGTGVEAQPSSQITSSPSVAGEYAGSVHNQTAGLSADFEVNVKDAGGILSGSMSVKPPLYGSGPLEGSANGSDVAFTVTSSLGKIAFVGTRIKKRITGTYTVTPPNGAIEKGTFTIDRVVNANRAAATVVNQETTDVMTPLPDTHPEQPHPDPATAPITTPPVQEHSDPKNLSSCLSGYAFCDHRLLTPAESLRVVASEKSRNLSVCMSGYGYCNHNLLTPEELPKVAAGEKSRNLAVCMSGYGYCNRNLLTQEELPKVIAGDKTRNLAVCMSGYGYCNHGLLTSEELPQVIAGEKSRNFSVCMSGYGYCNHTLLTPEELTTIQARDKQKHN